jgi:hypothetical protein
MAIYRIFPDKTATLYSRYPLFNTGLDEIMEVDSYYIGDTSYVARSLIAFNTQEQKTLIEGEISSSLAKVGSSYLNFSASLRAYLADGNEAPIEYTVEALPVYDDWSRGTGRFGDIPYATDGVNWVYANPNEYWTSPLASNTTASYSASADVVGGTWYTGSGGINLYHSQFHSVNSTHDLDIDVTKTVKLHYSHSIGQTLYGIPNNGFILKLTGSLEFQNTRNTFLKYYSANTHTIYPPFLEFKWSDYSRVTTLQAVTDDNIVITLANNKSIYTDEGKQRFRLKVRPQYPTRTFGTSSAYLTNFVLPATSYWGLRDENTEEMVIDFDPTYTRINADNSGNYFDVYMNGLQPERYYRILIKTEIDGTTAVRDNSNVFKVVRNG